MCNIQFPSAFTIHLSSEYIGSVLYTSSHPQFLPTFTTTSPTSDISLHSQRWRLRPGPVTSNRPYFAPCVPIHRVSPELEPEVDDCRWRITKRLSMESLWIPITWHFSSDEFSHSPKWHFHLVEPPVSRPLLVSNVPTSASPMDPSTSLRIGQKNFSNVGRFGEIWSDVFCHVFHV